MRVRHPESRYGIMDERWNALDAKRLRSRVECAVCFAVLILGFVPGGDATYVTSLSGRAVIAYHRP